MKWSDVTQAIGSAAPLIGTALGGPAGGVVGKLISNVLGVGDSPDAVIKELKSNPDALIKLKEFEYSEKESIRKYAFETLDAELKDKQSAREHHKHSNMPSIICVALTIMVGAGAWMLFTQQIPTENKNIANILFGSVLTQWGASIAYWVGTTRSSAEKTRLLK